MPIFSCRLKIRLLHENQLFSQLFFLNFNPDRKYGQKTKQKQSKTIHKRSINDPKTIQNRSKNDRVKTIGFEKDQKRKVRVISEVSSIVGLTLNVIVRCVKRKTSVKTTK